MAPLLPLATADVRLQPRAKKSPVDAAQEKLEAQGAAHSVPVQLGPRLWLDNVIGGRAKAVSAHSSSYCSATASATQDDDALAPRDG